MRIRSSALSFLLTLVFAGCDRSTGPDAGYLEIREVTVGPTLAKCYGVGLQSCMVVDGEFFYDGIEGFEYEPGYDYRLRIGKYDPWGGGGTAAGCRPVRLSPAGATGEDPGTIHPRNLVGGADAGDMRPE